MLRELDEVADACRQTAELWNPESDVASAAEHVQRLLGLYKHITTITLHQLDAILDQHPDEKLSKKRKEIIRLLNIISRTFRFGAADEEMDDDEQLDELQQMLIESSPQFAKIAERIVYIAAALRARPASPSVVHQTMITDSQIGGVAVGAQARAKGKASSSRSRSQR